MKTKETKKPIVAAILTAAVLAAALFLQPLNARGAPLDKDELLIGLIPEENIFTQVRRHRPLAAYLSDKLQVKVRFTILSKYGDIIDSFVSRELDGAFFGGFTAAMAHEKLGVEPAVRPVNLDGSETVRAYIIARADSNIKGTGDMLGLRAALVDKATATGYLFPVAYFRENGIPDMEAYLGEVFFTGSHDSTIYAVMDNRADIGATKSRIFDKMTALDPMIKEDLVVLARSEPLPDNTLCLREDLPPEFKKKIKDVLIDMASRPEGLRVLDKLQILRFTEATPLDFEAVKGLIKKAGINMQEYKYR